MSFVVLACATSALLQRFGSAAVVYSAAARMSSRPEGAEPACASTRGPGPWPSKVRYFLDFWIYSDAQHMWGFGRAVGAIELARTSNSIRPTRLSAVRPVPYVLISRERSSALVSQQPGLRGMAGVFTDVTMMTARLHRQPHGSETTACSPEVGKTDRALVAIATSARHEPAPALRALAPNARSASKLRADQLNFGRDEGEFLAIRGARIGPTYMGINLILRVFSPFLLINPQASSRGANSHCTEICSRSEAAMH